MTLVFADAFYLIALLNSDDAGNARACEFTDGYLGQYVTTSAVLTDFADALSRPESRLAAGRFLADLLEKKTLQVVSVDPANS